MGFAAKRDEEALSVMEAHLSMEGRVGTSEEHILVVTSNLAGIYRSLGRPGDCLRMRRDVYTGRLKLNGEEHPQTLQAANNYALCLLDLQSFKESRKLLRMTLPVARRVLREGH